jgi:hypothetical protein
MTRFIAVNNQSKVLIQLLHKVLNYNRQPFQPFA